MDKGIQIVSFFLAIGLALVHIFVSRTQWFNNTKTWWISISGGVSTAYIFLDIFPELNIAQAKVERNISFVAQYLEKHVYLFALIGFMAFQGLEKLARKSSDSEEEEQVRSGIFWIRIILFSIYNAILGYLLKESEQRGIIAVLSVFFALGLHLVVNDIGLRENNKQIYDRAGRWILAGAVVFGWVIDRAFPIDKAAILTIWSFIAGGILLNVLKEDVPEEQKSRFSLFAAGVVLYSVVRLAV